MNKIVLLILTILIVCLGYQSVQGVKNGASYPADTISLTLERSIELGFRNNKELQVAKERVKEAQAYVEEASTAFMPQLTGEMGYTRLDIAPFFPTAKFAQLGGGSMPPDDSGDIPKKITIGLPDNYSAALTLQQPIFTGGKLVDSYKISKMAKLSTESDLQRTNNELIFEIKKAYWHVINAQELEKVAKESTLQLEAHLEDLQSMYEAGLVATNELLRTKVRYSETKLLHLKARHAVRLVKKQFCDVVGIPLDSEVNFLTKAEYLPHDIIQIDTAIEEGLANRPEITTLEYQKMMAKGEVEIHRKGYLPDVFFLANLGYNYPDREYNKDFYTTWNIGIYAQMNIFDWGKNASKTQQARSRLAQLDITRQRIMDLITLDVSKTHLALVEVSKEIEVTSESVEQAEENLRVTHEKFKEGLTTNTELLDAQIMLIRAKAAYSNAITGYLIAEADLERAIGRTGR